ncbi:hypothetical protein GCM10009826_11020 [Humibacillus xanthopallidus]
MSTISAASRHDLSDAQLALLEPLLPSGLPRDGRADFRCGPWSTGSGTHPGRLPAPSPTGLPALPPGRGHLPVTTPPTVPAFRVIEAQRREPTPWQYPSGYPALCL